MSRLLQLETYTDSEGNIVTIDSPSYVGCIHASGLRNIFDSKPTTYTPHKISWETKQPYTWKGITEKMDNGITLSYIPLPEPQPEMDWHSLFNYSAISPTLMEMLDKFPQKEDPEVFTWNLQGPEPESERKSLIDVMKPLQVAHNIRTYEWHMEYELNMMRLCAATKYRMPDKQEFTIHIQSKAEAYDTSRLTYQGVWHGMEEAAKQAQLDYWAKTFPTTLLEEQRDIVMGWKEEEKVFSNYIPGLNDQVGYKLAQHRLVAQAEAAKSKYFVPDSNGDTMTPPVDEVFTEAWLRGAHAVINLIAKSKI